MLYLLATILQQSLIFLPLTFGVYLSYRILAVTDLTVEASFVLGAAIFARLVTNDHAELISLICALAGGFIIGILVCAMQKFAKINSLIAGILAVFMLYSVNFSVMGKPNINLLNSSMLLANLQAFHPIGIKIFLLIFCLILALLMIALLHSRTGLSLRAYGNNPKLLAMIGKKPIIYLALGLAISNMLAACCGVMTAEINGYADINMGLGMALTAIGAVVIGNKLTEIFFPSNRFSAVLGLISSFIGTFFYFSILNAFLALGIDPIYIKLVFGCVLVLFLSSAHLKKTQGKENELFART